VRKLIATWNPARDVWETGQPGFLCEHLAVFSATWPSSGMTLGGSAFELPMWEPPTPGSGTSLLPTPEAKLSDSGPDYARASRPRSGGDDLVTALHKLLPSPLARDHRPAGRGSDLRRNSPNLPAITQIGVLSAPPYAAGSESSDALPLDLE